MKTDMRVRYTRQVIRDAFWKLLRQKPVNKITVKEVCELAQINRGTFYKHYLDCYDLLEKTEDEVLSQFDEFLKNMEKLGFEETMVKILQILKENGESLRALYSNGNGTAFLHRLVRQGFRYADLRLAESPIQKWPESRREFGYTFLIGGCCSVMEHWIICGMRESPEEVAKAIRELSTILVMGMEKK